MGGSSKTTLLNHSESKLPLCTYSFSISDLQVCMIFSKDLKPEVKVLRLGENIIDHM